MVTTGFNIQNVLHADYIAFMCFVWISEHTLTFALSIMDGLFLWPKWSGFTARYGLSLYITQMLLVHKSLVMESVNLCVSTSGHSASTTQHQRTLIPVIYRSLSHCFSFILYHYPPSPSPSSFWSVPPQKTFTLCRTIAPQYTSYSLPFPWLSYLADCSPCALVMGPRV
jgi:hypothetical protein